MNLFCQHCAHTFTNQADFLRHTEQGVLYDNPLHMIPLAPDELLYLPDSYFKRVHPDLQDTKRGGEQARKRLRRNLPKSRSHHATGKGAGSRTAGRG